MEQFIKNMTPTQACFILAWVRNQALHKTSMYGVASYVLKRYKLDTLIYYNSDDVYQTARKVYYNAKRAKLRRQHRQYAVVTKARHNSLVRPTIPFLLAKGFYFNKQDTVYRIWTGSDIGLEINTNQKGTKLEMSWNLIGIDEGDYQFSQILSPNKLTVDNINQLLNIMPYGGET